MGVMLSQPITEKIQENGGNDILSFAVSSMQGYRVSMEDDHVAVTASEKDVIGFFGVFDGHSGRAAAEYCAKTLHGNVIANPAYPTDLKKALEEAYIKTDRDFVADNPDAGTTVVTVTVTKDKLICANSGDSRCVLSRGKVAVPLSHDHKPTNAEESARILRAGSTVTFDRVDGELAVARAIGDLRFKRSDTVEWKDQAVTAFPEVMEEEFTSDCEFILLACDGVWDVLTSQAAVDYIHSRLRETHDLQQLTDQLISYALLLGSKDNITAMIVATNKFLSSLPPPEPATQPPAAASEADQMD